jgi:hypothetical protein
VFKYSLSSTMNSSCDAMNSLTSSLTAERGRVVCVCLTRYNIHRSTHTHTYTIQYILTWKNGAGARRSTTATLARQTRELKCPHAKGGFRMRETGNLEPETAYMQVSTKHLQYPAKKITGQPCFGICAGHVFGWKLKTAKRWLFCNTGSARDAMKAGQRFDAELSIQPSHLLKGITTVFCSFLFRTIGPVYPSITVLTHVHHVWFSCDTLVVWVNNRSNQSRKWRIQWSHRDMAHRLPLEETHLANRAGGEELLAILGTSVICRRGVGWASLDSWCCWDPTQLLSFSSSSVTRSPAPSPGTANNNRKAVVVSWWVMSSWQTWARW